MAVSNGSLQTCRLFRIVPSLLKGMRFEPGAQGRERHVLIFSSVTVLQGLVHKKTLVWYFASEKHRIG
jgi:hypothetical protein